MITMHGLQTFVNDIQDLNQKYLCLESVEVSIEGESGVTAGKEGPNFGQGDLLFMGILSLLQPDDGHPVAGFIV